VHQRDLAGSAADERRRHDVRRRRAVIVCDAVEQHGRDESTHVTAPSALVGSQVVDDERGIAYFVSSR
jgi:hypothetical protein